VQQSMCMVAIGAPSDALTLDLKVKRTGQADIHDNTSAAPMKMRYQTFFGFSCALHDDARRSLEPIRVTIPDYMPKAVGLNLNLASLNPSSASSSSPSRLSKPSLARFELVLFVG
jgi:hypothetical protein